MPEDVRLIKVEVPAGATPETPWRVVRQAPFRYFQPLPPKREKLGDSAPIPYVLSVKPGDVSVDTDVHTLVYDRVVAVTPLSLEMTSRVDLKEFEKMLRDPSK
jgi:5'-nucleotidase